MDEELITEETTDEVAPPEEEQAPKEPKQSLWNLYTVLLAISFVALLIAIFLMVLELSQYQFNFSANLVG